MKYFILITLYILSLNYIAYSQEKYTAAQFYAKADSIATQNYCQPYLRIIRSEDVNIIGKSEYWNFTYDSLKIYISRDSIHCTHYDYMLTGATRMDSGWFDSDSALRIAEREGGEAFRLNNPDCKISVDLSKASASPYTEWSIDYGIDDVYGVYFHICMDALTGEITTIRNTAVSQNKNTMNDIVCQNFPNPFNAVTTFSYSLEKSSSVRLKIYDILGKEVEILIDGLLAEGKYRMKWDARDYPSGIYFYLFSDGERTIKRKLQVIR